MADNVEADAGSGGAIFASDDIGGVQYPRAKVVWGVDGAAVDASASNPLPVVQTGTHTVDLGATDNAVLDSAVALLTTIDADTSNLSVVGGGTEAAAIRVTIANNSTGVLSVDDNGGALTVDGTVTANLSATDNAVLDAIAASVAGTLTVAGTVDLGATDNAVLDSAVALLTTIDADTGGILADTAAIQTAVELIDDTVVAVDAVGTSAKVVMVGAIRDDSLSALTPVENDAVPLRVDSTGALHVTGAGGGTQYAVDAALGANPTGTLAVAIRDDALSSLTPVEGDAVGLRVDSTGALWVAATAGAAQYADDEAFTLTSDAIIGIGAIRDDSLSTLSAAEGDMVPFRVSSTGALHVTGGGGGTQYTEDAAAAANPVGTAVMLIRDDAPGALVSADGDNVAQRGTDFGAAFVQVVDSSGNFIDTFGGAGGTSSADDADFTAGTTLGTIVQGVYESSPTSITDGDVGAIGLTQTRAIRTSVEGTVTVGSHAVTNAGTFAVQVDGNALTALQLIDNVVHVDDAAFTLGTSSGVMMMGFAGTQAVNANDAAALACETDGSLHIHDGGNSITVDGTVAVSGTVTVGSHAVTNAGTFAVQVDGSALTALQLIDNPILVDDAAFTPATSSVSMAGFQADEASTDSVDEGDAGAARMTLDRKQIVTIQPHTAGGLTIFRSIDLDESEEEVKASAGCVYGMWVTNTATSTRWIKFYNATAANVTVGSTTPVITWGIPGNTSDDVSGLLASGLGITFDTAITVAATTGVADADTGAPGANEIIINLFYK